MKNEIVDVFKHKLESNSCNHLAKNVKSASFEENMLRLKVEFQKTIRVLLPTNKQTVTAAGQGAIAALSAYTYLRS